MDRLKRYIRQLSNNITRVAYTFSNEEPENSELISEGFFIKPSDISMYENSDKGLDFFNNTSHIISEVGVKLEKKEVLGCQIDGEPIIGTKLTANGEVTFIENAVKKFERFSNTASLEFEIGEEEYLLGLGQYEDGIFNYRNHTEFLYQSNMRIAIPFLITTGGYGILIDTQSNMVFRSREKIIRFEIDTTENLVYYVITGKDISEIILHYQELTGNASMLPRWTYGYIQSKERYNSAMEIESVVNEFRKRHIPIDCIVQDWYTWEDGLWGEKILDKKRYPNLPSTVQKLHSNNVKLMVSIWPNMSPMGKNYKEFNNVDGLLANSNVYNAFDSKYRKLYWEQCEKEIISSGTDALWCDNSEPFSDADWNGVNKRPEELRYELVVEDSKKSMPWEKINSYGLYHAKGIWENWRQSIPDKRVVNLTRSGYVGSQRYGTILWSGDICAKWDTIRKQITEGIKMGLSGNPYWTLDIGGFFTVKDKYENRGCNDKEHKALWFWDGDYNEGVKDPEYRELYTRWIQFGVFLPMFRSHGTDTPREPWQFIYKEDKESYYEVIINYIKLRYKLLPYIYSLAYRAHTEAYIIMRSFAFDYCNDKDAIECHDEYMFGPAFLVAPIYKPQNHGSYDCNLKKCVYLPKGNGWYDYWTNEYFSGGQIIDLETDINKIPLFIKEGSIIPMSDSIEYADQRDGSVKRIAIYEGMSGVFELYNDFGDGYDYLKGKYSCIRITYDDSCKRVIIGDNAGKMKVDTTYEIELIKRNGEHVVKLVEYVNKKIILSF